jgi:Rieske Fe-S protein
MHRKSFLQLMVGIGFNAAIPLRAKADHEAVSVPLPKDEWDSVEFSFNSQGQSLPGIVIRLPSSNTSASPRLFVACKICPHQGCQFGYEQNFSLVSDIIGKDLTNPVLFCRCHMSTYDPAKGGEVVNGPAPRPPWTFQYVITESNVLVTDVEAGVGNFD